MKKLWISLRLFLWMTFVTGIAYPLLITMIAQTAMKDKASGGLISANGKTVGAKLIAQKFESNKYFWARPSSIDYNPLPSGGSNLGPTSIALKKAIDERKAAIVKAQGTLKGPIPSELLFSSGSGLDPHISPATAHFQVDRVAKARNMNDQSSKDKINELIEKLTEKRRFGILGNSVVNVLELNIALDKLGKFSSSHGE
jgi:potassium-transporting ATPase KdpC subunit